MTSLSKFLIKIYAELVGLLLKNNISGIREAYYNKFGREARWISLAVNKNQFEGSPLTRELQVHNKSDISMHRFALKEKKVIMQVWQDEVLLKKATLSIEDQTWTYFNEFLDQFIEKTINTYQNKLQILDSKTFTSAEVATEDRALEWIRVSYKMIEKAVIESLTNPELLFQTLLFMGTNPKTEREEIRLIIFNLDLKYEILPNNLLRIRIYNDKNEEFGSAKKASLEGDFNYRKREMLDELTRLLSIVSKGLKI